MSKAKSGSKRLMITLPEALVQQLEKDTQSRGLKITKSVRIQLALEEYLRKSNTSHEKRNKE